MKKYLLLSFIFISVKAMAQVPEDALRYSWFPQNAGARILGAGGVMGSVGGDISAAYVNPAGLGFFRTSEAVISPGYFFNNSKGSYRGSTSADNKNSLSFGPSGIIIAAPNSFNSKQSRALAISFTQVASFANRVSYKGYNNYSSYSEKFAEEFTGLHKSIDQVLDQNSIAPYTVAPALYTFLIDTVTIGGKLIVKGAPEYVLDQGKALQQEMLRTTKGGLYELNFAFAGNDGEKLLYGLGVGIPIVNYESNTVFTETDTSADATNYFKSFSYNDNFTTKGAGLNLRGGLIYRPQEYFRIGLALQTPSFMLLTDSRETSLHTVLENPAFDTTITSGLFTNGERGKAKYQQNSPWKATLSASYVFREVADVTKQRGFISADVEYVNHRGSRFSSANEEVTADDKAYYKQLNNVVKNIYKGAVNLRVGGELKFNTIMARIGFGYYGNPYKDAPSKVNKMTLSSGLGYRNKGFFIDVAYVHLIINDFDVPYRLEAAQNTFAALKQTRGNVVATVGVKF